MSNHVAAEARILEASPHSYSPTDQSVEGMLSDSVESLHLVPTAKLARKESTETFKLGETGNPTTAEFCLSEPSPSSLPGRVEEREAGVVDATGLMPVCGNGSKRSGHREPGKALSRRQKRALRRKMKHLGNEDMDVAVPLGALTPR
ncbi:unnamed protein product [Hermetia illucens]|uniref:Uncharacterized protein n=1 Tax=Hermetia illucens TaxID=343691 RepID=A0A7R8V5W5_HERIL|nr:unnamed protein product [Hermetia illucens]